MKKNMILAMLLVCLFATLPIVNAQTGLTTINESISTQQNYHFVIANAAEGDVLYMNLTVTEGMNIIVEVYRGVTQIPGNEVYQGSGISFFEANITLVEGQQTVYLYNPSLESILFVHGVWGINYESSVTTTVPTDFTDTTGTGTVPTRPVDYLDIFMSIMLFWVIPAIALLVAITILYVYFFKNERFDYLTIFGEDELVGHRGKDAEKKDND